MQAQGDVGILGGIGTGLFQWHLVERELLGALAGNVLEVDGFKAQQAQRHAVHIVALGGIEHIGLEHGVEGDPPQLDTVTGQHTHVVFQVLPHFFDLPGFEEGPKLPQELLGFLLIFREGDVEALMSFPAEGNPDQFCLHGVQRGSLCVETNPFLLHHAFYKQLQCLSHLHRLVEVRHFL